jgi:hypothetical protein
LDSAIREVLITRAGIPINYYTEISRATGSERSRRRPWPTYIKRKYERHHIDVVMR